MADLIWEAGERAQEPSSRRFERRTEDRWPAEGVAWAHLVAGERFGDRCTLKLRDESYDGLGALSDRPIEPGSPVTVGFAEPGRWRRSGVVLRCEPCGDGYAVAVRYERRLAA